MLKKISGKAGMKFHTLLLITAFMLVKLVSERTNQIAETPFMYRLTDFKDFRVASLGNYNIYYRISETDLIISAFWDNRQDLKKLMRVLQSGK